MHFRHANGFDGEGPNLLAQGDEVRLLERATLLMSEDIEAETRSPNACFNDVTFKEARRATMTDSNVGRTSFPSD